MKKTGSHHSKGSIMYHSGKWVWLGGLCLALVACTPDRSGTSSDPSIKVDNGSKSDQPKNDAGVIPSGVDSGGTGGPVTGGKTCQEIFVCFDTCAENDQACADGCINQGSADGQAKAQAVDQCEEQAFQVTCSSQCKTEDDTCGQCVDQACNAQYAACFTSSTTPDPNNPSGSWTCGEIDDCVMNCPDNDNNCFDNCVQQGSAQAQSVFKVFDECIMNAFDGGCVNQCQTEGDTCEQCLEQVCSSQFAQCYGS